VTGCVMQAIHAAFPRLRHLFADSAYAGAKLRTVLAPRGRWTGEIVKRADAAQGFVLLPRRWAVERTLAWLNRDRRLAQDFEATIARAETWPWIASVKLMVRRLATAYTMIVNYESDLDGGGMIRVGANSSRGRTAMVIVLRRSGAHAIAVNRKWITRSGVSAVSVGSQLSSSSML
jgi:transposase